MLSLPLPCGPHLRSATSGIGWLARLRTINANKEPSSGAPLEGSQCLVASIQNNQYLNSSAPIGRAKEPLMTQQNSNFWWLHVSALPAAWWNLSGETSQYSRQRLVTRVFFSYFKQRNGWRPSEHLCGPWSPCASWHFLTFSSDQPPQLGKTVEFVKNIDLSYPIYLKMRKKKKKKDKPMLIPNSCYAIITGKNCWGHPNWSVFTKESANPRLKPLEPYASFSSKLLLVTETTIGTLKPEPLLEILASNSGTFTWNYYLDPNLESRHLGTSSNLHLKHPKTS